MSEEGMALVSDPTGERINGGEPPRRIVSICPPITELLFDIGIKEQVIAVSKQCQYPEVRVKNLPSVGNCKRPDLRMIQELAPDLVILDSRETDPSVVTLLREEFAVWDSTSSTILEVIEEIKALGALVQKSLNADWIANKIAARFAEFQDSFVKPRIAKKIAFLANYKPWTAYGAGTLANELLQLIGVENVWAIEKGVHVVEDRKLPGGSLTTILVAEGPYSFHKRHVPVVNRKFPDSAVNLVRGDLLTWQGSRLLRTPAYLAELAKLLQQ